MPKVLGDVLSKLQTEKISISPEGRMLIEGRDIIELLKDVGVQLPEGDAKPLNYLQCNLSNCGGGKVI
jgi:hypothetical protein